MQPVRKLTEHPPKATKPRPWVLTFTLKARHATHNQTLAEIKLKDSYPTREGAVQALEAIQRGAGMWRKELWEVVNYQIISNTK